MTFWINAYHALVIAAVVHGERPETVAERARMFHWFGQRIAGVRRTLDDVRRARFADTLLDLLDPGGLYLMMCFSDKVPGTFGPRRVTQDEIRETFAGDGWDVREIREATFESREPRMPQVPSWLAIVERL